MSRRPDTVVSSPVKREPADDHHIPPSAPSTSCDDDDDDPIVRTIDVFISPELSNTLHLLQFPIEPTNRQHVSKRDISHTPTEAKFRPKHKMLELEYNIPSSAQRGERQLPDKMCLSQRTFTSNSIAPVTHMALGKLDKSGTRLDIVPIQNHVLQLRPSFAHLHEEEEEDKNANAAVDESKVDGRSGGRQRPIMFAKKETERTANARRNSYAYKRASEEGEQWIDLDVHGIDGKWSSQKKDMMGKIECKDRENELKLAKNSTKSGTNDGGYVKSLNYLDSYSLGKTMGEAFVENLSDWAPSTVNAVNTENLDDVGDDDGGDVDMTEGVTSSSIGATEQATAELAAKLAILLQTGNGTMIPYRVIRSRFQVNNVSDEILTMALSSCAVLVRGNFALKSDLAKFLNISGSGERKKKLLRELRDLILLLLNMHGMVQRERLIHAYSTKGESTGGYGAITGDMITFVLKTVARKSDNCWVAKVEDDEKFAAKFPDVGACHAMYWMKKKEMLVDLLELYENAEIEDE